MFSKSCTECGARTTARPDVYLVARLCTLCRYTELQELNSKTDELVKLDLVCYTSDSRPKRDAPEDTRYRYTKGAVFAFKWEVQEAREAQQTFRKNDDEASLAEWEEDRRAAAQARHKDTHQLSRYIYRVTGSREDELEQIKEQRRTTIFERLKTLAWTEEDMVFKGSEAKPWNALLNAPKVLTERVWTNILPQLTQMLADNRERHTAEAKKQRRSDRRTCIDRFLIRMKYTAHPFEPIFQAVPIGNWGKVLNDVCPVEANPFPKTLTALEWSCLKDLDELELSTEEVEAKLEQRRPEIQEKVLEWRNKVERCLVERFGPDLGGTQDEVILSVNGSLEIASSLPRNTRLLLRADTLFDEEQYDPDPDGLLHFGPEAPCYYPHFISRVTDRLDLSEERYSTCRSKETNPNYFGRDPKTMRVVKLMLQDLGMPDVSHVELNVMRERFMCGRCLDQEPTSWSSCVWHYMEHLESWERQTDPTRQPAIRHPIEIRNPHDIDSLDDRKPLIRLLREEKATEIRKKYKSLGRGPDYMRKHLLDMHNVTQPVEEIHYGRSNHWSSESKAEWNEKWDAYHDALEGAGEAAE
ncbi:valine-tRNA ligase [Ceratobasidium sp. AG-Ba]|nr:valine-tRNA ligase [Ceratobasidium sp. AG-Ba]